MWRVIDRSTGVCLFEGTYEECVTYKGEDPCLAIV